MELQDIPQPQIATNPYMTPIHSSNSNIIYLTNPEDELYRLELCLRSQILDKEGTPKEIGKPIMNEEGIGKLLGLAQSIVNRITIMSVLDTKKEITPLILFAGDSLNKLLMMEYKNFDLNPHYRDFVVNTFLNITYVCMKRAVADNLSDKKFWRGSVQEIHSQVEASNKKGILSRLWDRQGK